ncbi:hypothetical protein TYRP_020212, partial [Tyrophagus putrescentiae]
MQLGLSNTSSLPHLDGHVPRSHLTGCSCITAGNPKEDAVKGGANVCPAHPRPDLYGALLLRQLNLTAGSVKIKISFIIIPILRKGGNHISRPASDTSLGADLIRGWTGAAIVLNSVNVRRKLLLNFPKPFRPTSGHPKEGTVKLGTDVGPAHPRPDLLRTLLLGQLNVDKAERNWT